MYRTKLMSNLVHSPILATLQNVVGLFKRIEGSISKIWTSGIQIFRSFILHAHKYTNQPTDRPTDQPTGCESMLLSSKFW